MWESQNGQDPVGDGGRSIGPYHIQRAYWQDAMEWANLDWSYRDARDPERSLLAGRAYLDRWGTHYEETTGRRATLEVLARIHNGGPAGWRKTSTGRYWREVKRE